MFEKFTEGALKVIMLAREEARRLEFNQVKQEHLFLATLNERNGLGARALTHLGIDLKKARRAVERLIGRGYSNAPLQEISFSPQVIQMLSSVEFVAEAYHATTVDTEHILVHLLVSFDEEFAPIFNELGTRKDLIISSLQYFLDQGLEADRQGLPVDLPEHYSARFLTPLATQVLDDARQEAINLKHISIGTEQILIGLLRHEDSLAGQVLQRHHVDEAFVRMEIHRLIGIGSGTVSEILDFTHISKRALESAWAIARQYPAARIGTAHLLLGILQVDEGTANHLFHIIEGDTEQIRLDLIQMLNEYPNNPEPTLEYANSQSLGILTPFEAEEV